MRRRRADRFRPVLNTAEVALTPSIGDIADGQECRAMLVKIPEHWEFKRIDDGRLAGEVETVTIRRRHPDGVPAGRYLRLPVDTLVDPWGRVSIGLEFETPNGFQRAELILQSHEEEAVKVPADPHPAAADGIQLDAKSLVDLCRNSSIFFVEGSAGDVLDLSDDRSGRWSMGDSDGSHTLYIRRDRAGKRGATLAVRNGIEVKLA